MALTFGTAGIRGPLGPGPDEINLGTVGRVSVGLGAFLADARVHTGVDAHARVVIGCDARHHSTAFALEAAGLLAGLGHESLLLPHPVPTPVLAYAVRALEADAGVMITASHNPASDNGLKVYLGGCLTDARERGVQIVPPVDEEIQGFTDRVRGGPEDWPRGDWTLLSDAVEDDYVKAIIGLVPPPAGAVATRRARLTLVLTPLHGIGGATALSILEATGFTNVHVVPEQAAPDPDFPTVAFPNPEEPGAMDLALSLAQEYGAAMAIALDPDADRCGIGAEVGGAWVTLRGDTVGCLLGAQVARALAMGKRLAGTEEGARTLASSIVSSRLLSAIAARHRLHHVTTLTGFKWLARVPGLAYGYEEALGLCVAPDIVRDKDGISAALAMAEYASLLSEEGHTLADALDDLDRVYGVHETALVAVRLGSLTEAAAVVARLASSPPASLGGETVVEVADMGKGIDGLPPTPGARFVTTSGARVVVRPSGTEPKVKAYLEVVRPIEDDVRRSRVLAGAAMMLLEADVREILLAAGSAAPEEGARPATLRRTDAL